ncbi:MAG TPA: hypothetical protein VMA95_22330 [Streptosporangiaceae bacterium]|nr:hypothetical protein [Streptosporangiaceae bacterium]
MSEHAELEKLAAIVREVLINFQNSSGAVLILTNYSLTMGKWDPAAESGVPVQGHQVEPGQSPTWGNATETPFTGVAGKMTFIVNDVTVTVTWSWAYGAVPTADVSVIGSSTLTASVALSNKTSSVVTATVTLAGS